MFVYICMFCFTFLYGLIFVALTGEKGFTCGFAWSDMVHGCMVHTERAKMATVSCGTSHASAVSTPLRWIFKNALWKAIHSCRITCERSESARKRRTALYKSAQQHTRVLKYTFATESDHPEVVLCGWQRAKKSQLLNLSLSLHVPLGVFPAMPCNRYKSSALCV